MVVIRNVFRLKFGQAKQVLPILKEGLAIQKRLTAGTDVSARLLTDVTGPFYTVVLELTVRHLPAWRPRRRASWVIGRRQENYQKLVPFVESGYREVFTVVE